MNLYAELVYTQNILFHIDDEGKLTFGKTENRHLSYRKIKGHYKNVPSALSEDVNNFLSPKLLEAIVEKIHEEVSAKVSLDDVGFQIKSEIAFRHRNHTADRLKKAIYSAFADVHINCFNIFYYDKTNFNVSMTDS